MAGPDGRVMHAEIRVFNTRVMLSHEFPEREVLSPEALKGTPVGLFVYTRDVDRAIARPSPPVPRSRCRPRTCSGATASEPFAIHSGTTGSSPPTRRTSLRRRWRGDSRRCRRRRRAKGVLPSKALSPAQMLSASSTAPARPAAARRSHVPARSTAGAVAA